MLAKQRASAKSNENSLPNPSDSVPSFPKPPTKGSKLSKLASLAKKRDSSSLLNLVPEKDTEKHTKPLLVRKLNGSGLSLRKRATEAKSQRQRAHSPAEGLPTPPSLNNEDQIEVMEEVRNTQGSLKLAELNSEFEFDMNHSALLQIPHSKVLKLLFESPEETENHLNMLRKRRKLAPELFHAYTNSNPNIAKARSNFSLPSPDDKVLDAQKQAFEKDLKKLTINDVPKEKKIPTKTKAFKTIDLAKELTQNPNFTKPNKSFVIIGHVDAGKSTLMGRILYDSGTVDAKTVNKLVREAEKSGKGSFALAWIMDQTSEERSRGVTIDICATYFETKSTRFTAIDAPGHKDFVPQLIGGVSQADIALLVVDSINGEFEAGFVMDGQTKEHTLIVKNLGIEKLCIAINKMDKENWSEDRFMDIKEQLTQFLTGAEVGFAAENLSFIPISGLSGTNVVKNDQSVSELSWYKGPTLIEYLETVEVPGNHNIRAEDISAAEFNLAINEIYDVTNSEFKVKGKVSLGYIQPGVTVRVQPTNDFLQVQSVFFNEAPVDVGIYGQIVLLSFKVNQLKNKSVEDLMIGDILLSIDSTIHSVTKFHASVSMFNMPKPLLVGTPFVLFRNNASIAARITKVESISGSKKKKMHLVSKQSAEVIIEVMSERSLPVAKFIDNKSLGRVVIRREGTTVGAGIVTATQ